MVTLGALTSVLPVRVEAGGTHKGKFAAAVSRSELLKDDKKTLYLPLTYLLRRSIHGLGNAQDS